MKITIDTKEDSAADIRKVIALLSKMIEDSSESRDIFADSSPGLGTSEASEPSSGNAFANMFGSSSSDEKFPVLGLDEDGSKEVKKEGEEEPSVEIVEY